MKYKYKGRGERLVRAEDFEALDVEHCDVFFNADNGFVQDLTDEAAQALINVGEPLVVEEVEEDLDQTNEEPVDPDASTSIVDKELAEDEIEKAKTTKASTRKRT